MLIFLITNNNNININNKSNITQFVNTEDRSLAAEMHNIWSKSLLLSLLFLPHKLIFSNI